MQRHSRGFLSVTVGPWVCLAPWWTLVGHHQGWHLASRWAQQGLVPASEAAAPCAEWASLVFPHSSSKGASPLELSYGPAPQGNEPPPLRPHVDEVVFAGRPESPWPVSSDCRSEGPGGGSPGVATGIHLGRTPEAHPSVAGGKYLIHHRPSFFPEKAIFHRITYTRGS